jgi:prepilin-type N-terminal cleavage/methylation domain-containing protein
MKQTIFKRVRGLSGFTLLEVLVAAVIGSIAISAGLQLYVSQNKSQIIQAGISDMQQNGRAAIDELASKIRHTGYRVPLGVSCLRGWNSNPDAIALSYLAEPLCTASLTATMASPTAEIKLVGYNLTCFQDNSWGFIYDKVTRTGEYFFITQVVTATGTIQHTSMALSKSYPTGAQVLMMNYVKYYIDKSDTLHPKFMVQTNGGTPEIYADNIEDLQFRYTTANNMTYDTVAVDRYVREIAIQLVARTEKNDLFMKEYRRDTLKTSVMIRNLAM